ncbi:hypothetical protein [Bradyrhizobium sp. LA7.1]|uniref:hypothetical protein n=1 Tax=Bradyrhizobium sp. LA7.1 TaxID=3156324 RepID=UPI00339A3C89
MTKTVDQWRSGLLRLYAVIAVPWVLWFGYGAYEAHGVYTFNRDYTEAFEKLPPDPTKNWANYYGATSNRDEYRKRRDTNLTWLCIVPAGYPIVMFALLWVIDGFRRR